MESIFCTVNEAVEAIRQGEIVIVVDDENRENEGDFLMAAQMATPEKVNFMMKFGRGLICTPLSKTRAVKLGLEQMVPNNEDPHKTAFTVSVDGVGTGTGISASNRSKTIQMLADGQEGACSFQRPGHIFPLVAKDGGVIERPGHTEAAVDLMRLAGFSEAGVICEIIKDDGEMARMPDLKEIADVHGLKILTIEMLIEHMAYIKDRSKSLVETVLPTKHGVFQLHAFTNKHGIEPHLALVMGDVSTGEPLIRIHSECMTGDVFGSRRCDCGQQLDASMKVIADEGRGILIYMRQEGRGIGLVDKLKAYRLQDGGLDTVEANLELGRKDDERTYDESIAILKSFGIVSGRLMTNNPLKMDAFSDTSIAIARCDYLKPEYHDENRYYLDTKLEKMGHVF